MCIPILEQSLELESIVLLQLLRDRISVHFSTAYKRHGFGRTYGCFESQERMRLDLSGKLDNGYYQSVVLRLFCQHLVNLERICTDSGQTPPRFVKYEQARAPGLRRAHLTAIVYLARKSCTRKFCKAAFGARRMSRRYQVYKKHILNIYPICLRSTYHSLLAR